LQFVTKDSHPARGLVHRRKGEATRSLPSVPSEFLRCGLFRWDCEEPDQQTEKKQRAHQREQGV